MKIRVGINGKSAVLAFALTITSALVINAQSTAPTARTPGSPAGAYSLSDLDNVNLFSGNLNFNLTLLPVNGRGESNQKLSLTLETQWDAQRSDSGNVRTYQLNPRSQAPVGFVGQLRSETTAEARLDDYCLPGFAFWVDHRFNFTFVEPDGTEHMLVGRRFRAAG